MPKAYENTVHVVVRTNPDFTPEQARDVRVRAWKFVFDSYRRKTTQADGGEDAPKLEERTEDGKLARKERRPA